MIGAFLFWEAYTPTPMLDIRFFRNRRFSAASLTITLTYFAMFGSTFLLTQYFQFVLGYSPLKAGAMTAPIAIGLVIGGPRAPRLVERYGTKYVVEVGLALVLLALSLYGVDTIMSNPWLGATVRGVFGLGIGLTTAPATESIMGSLPKNRAGVGSAVNDTTRQTGGALGVAVLGSIFAYRYHSVVGEALGVAPAAREAAKDSIGKAVAAASRLPASDQGPLKALSDHAAMTGMRTAYLVGCAFVAMAMVVCWLYLPSHAPEPEAEAGGGRPRSRARRGPRRHRRLA